MRRCCVAESKPGLKKLNNRLRQCTSWDWIFPDHAQLDHAFMHQSIATPKQRRRLTNGYVPPTVDTDSAIPVEG